MGLPGGSDGRESACSAGDPGLIPGSGRLPWSKGTATHSSPMGWAWQPSPIFRLENPHGQRSLAGCSPWGRKEWDRLPTPVFLGFPGSSVSKESACNSGDVGSDPELGRSPAGGHGNSLQYSRLENPHGQRSSAGCSPWGCKELDTTE